MAARPKKQSLEAFVGVDTHHLAHLGLGQAVRHGLALEIKCGLVARERGSCVTAATTVRAREVDPPNL